MLRLVARSAGLVAGVAALVVLGWVGKLWWESRLPETYGVMDYGSLDYGGGPVPSTHVSHDGGISVADLRGPREGAPDARFTLTAREATIRLASGREVEALTFDGAAPGPELRVTEGDLVEVTLANEDVDAGVTVHWHGVDVPNAEDGVAGVTQDAVLPGERHVYRFRAEQVGTFWYHTHQVSSKEVRRGLFGALVIEPSTGPLPGLDVAVVAHTFAGIPTLNAGDGIARRRVEAGTAVRLRLVNSDSTEQRFTLSGAPFRVVALDGTDLHEPTPLEGVTLPLGAGGRMDVELTMPAGPVLLSLVGTGAGIALSPDGGSVPSAPPAPGPDFDAAVYGTRAAAPFGTSTAYDRRFELELTRRPGFLRGRPGLQWAINGKIFPHVPVLVVDEGDVVEVTIENRTGADHPMHLHGHHVLVLERDGRPVSGSPWWADTLNVGPGESYRVGFRADNPGIWMDHCHNLRHAADGLTMHVAYAGVTTPFQVGAEHHNTPE